MAISPMTTTTTTTSTDVKIGPHSPAFFSDIDPDTRSGAKLNTGASDTEAPIPPKHPALFTLSTHTPAPASSSSTATTTPASVPAVGTMTPSTHSQESPTKMNSNVGVKSSSPVGVSVAGTGGRSGGDGQRSAFPEEPKSPLTPPLTPAYSLCTADAGSTPGNSIPLLTATRFVRVDGVPPDAEWDALRQAFTPCGEISRFFTGLQVDRGIVILVFFDPRAAKNALDFITTYASSSVTATPQGWLPLFPSSRRKTDNGVVVGGPTYPCAPVRLSARLIDSEELGELAGPESPYYLQGDTELLVTVRTTSGAIPPSFDQQFPYLPDPAASYSPPVQLPSPAASSATSLPPVDVEEVDGRVSSLPSAVLEAPMTMTDAFEEVDPQETMIHAYVRKAFEQFGEIRSFKRTAAQLPELGSESWQLLSRQHHPHPTGAFSPSTHLGMAFTLEYWDTRALAVAKNALDGSTAVMKMPLIVPSPSPSHGGHPPSPPCSVRADVDIDIDAGGLGLGLGLISKSKGRCIPVGIGVEHVVEIEVRLGVVFAPQTQAQAQVASGRADTGHASGAGTAWDEDEDEDEDDGDGHGSTGRSATATQSTVVIPANPSISPAALVNRSAIPPLMNATTASPSTSISTAATMTTTAAGGFSISPSKTATTTHSTPPPFTRRSSTGSTSLPGELTDLLQQLKAASTASPTSSEAEGEWKIGGNGDRGADTRDADVFNYSALACGLTGPSAAAPYRSPSHGDLDEVDAENSAANVETKLLDWGGADRNALENNNREAGGGGGRMPMIRRTSSGLGGRSSVMVNQSRTAPSTPRREATALSGDRTSPGLLFSTAFSSLEVTTSPTAILKNNTSAAIRERGSEEKVGPADQLSSFGGDNNINAVLSSSSPESALVVPQQQWLPSTTQPPPPPPAMPIPMHPYPMPYSPKMLPQSTTLPPHSHPHAHVYHHPMQLHPHHQYAIDSTGLAYYPPTHPQSPVDHHNHHHHHHLVPPPPPAMQHVPPYPMFTPTSPVNGAQFYPAQPHPHQQTFHFAPSPHFQQPNGGGGGGNGYGFLPAPLVQGTHHQDGVPLSSPTELHHIAQPYQQQPLNPAVEAFSPRPGMATMRMMSPGIHFKSPPPASSSITDVTGTNTTSPSASTALKLAGSRAPRAVAPLVPSGGTHPPPPPVLLGHNNPRWRGNTHHSALLRTSRGHPSSSPNGASRNGHHRPSVHVPHHMAMRPRDPAGGGGGGGQYGSKLGWSGGGAAVTRKPTPEANIVDVDKIEKGLDTRTTVMLKNIPNKMTARDLIAFLHNVVPNSLDFLYLRIDFTNQCNVGYAFANFIDTADLLKFCKTCLGEKWGLFQSEKVIQMNYANYQGKDALVDKFRNSAVLNERPEWRPQLFHSSGPDRGQPHPFPAPNSAIRRERSAQLKSTGMYSQTPRLHAPAPGGERRAH